MLLWSSRWLRNARRRMNLPVTVALNRFAAALRVLSLGISMRFHKLQHYDADPPEAKFDMM